MKTTKEMNSQSMTCKELSVKTTFANAAGPPNKEWYSKQASERRVL